MSKYIVKECVCDFGIYLVGDYTEDLIDICNSRANALKICEILNVDMKHGVYKDQRISELEEQLKNAIVPKFKIGQEVWFVYAKDVRKYTIFMLHIDKGGVVYECYVDDTRYSICCKDKSVYATKEEAEARLKELQGEKK